MRQHETPYPPVERLLTGHETRVHNRCWRPQGTPTLLLVHTRSGYGEVRVDGRDDPQVLAPGDTMLWPAGVAHDFGTSACDTQPWELVWAHFHPRGHWHDWLGWPALGRGVRRMPAPADRLLARAENALLEMDAHARSTLPRATEFALNALEQALLWLDAGNPGAPRIHEAVQEAILFVARHLDQRVGVRDIADAVHLSPSRLAHVFSQEIGVSPGRFVEQRRMERARVLLETSSLSIGAVAAATGFSSPFYFSARFRAHTGTSPSDWRGRARSR
jgi:AraC family transcriptional regulator, arabinose operon regulatory protein